MFIKFITILMALHVRQKAIVKPSEYSKNIDMENVLSDHELKFNRYLYEFNKSYSSEEYIRRLEIFKESLINIAKNNALEGSEVYGLTKFSDISDEELSPYLIDKESYTSPCHYKNRTCIPSNNNYVIKDLIEKGKPPENFDWREKNFVTPVLDQKTCNTCWAFSIVGAMETMAAIRGYGLTSYSSQELIDCMGKGCMEFGNVEKGLNYLCDDSKTIVTEKVYPLNLAYDNFCNVPPNPVGIKLQYYSYQCDVDENEMVAALSSHGPLIVVVDATNWKNYIGGVIRYSCSRERPYHAVQIVGYHGYGATDGSVPYYIIKNSYGNDFGENGYVKLAMFENVCGIREHVAKVNVLRKT